MSLEHEEKINYIKHYQSSIQKNQNLPNRVLHCLKKLQNVRINVNHLQETGIGKTVYLCRKYEGETGELAKELIEKWKTVVTAVSSESENDHKGTSKITPPDQTHKSTKKTDEKHSVSNIDKNKSSKSSSHSSDKHRKTKGNEHTSSSSSTSKKRSHDESNHHPKEKLAENESKKMKTENVKSASRSSSSKDQSKSHKSSSSTNGHHKHHKKDPKKDNKKKESSVEEPKEFDDTQGIGFAEALAFFDIPSSSTKQHKKEQMPGKMVTTTKSIPSKAIKPEILSKPPERKKSSSPPFFRPIHKLTDPPKLLTQKPKIDLLSDIASDLSVGSLADYRPLPLNSAMKEYINSNVHGSSSSSRHAGSKPMNDSEMFESFTSRENRTRVYSGNAKARGAIPTLKTLCIKVVADNIDLLEYTGGVPYDIMEPVLKQAKPEQLTNIEYYNPYLVINSDILWKPHCTKKWKNKKPQEMETWRDMYERCTQEDEDKLNRLTNLIKHNQEVTSNGIQKTKMAFVDTMVKPPRNMMRKQEQFGTNHKLVVSAAARVDSLKRLIPNIAKPGDVRLRVAAGLRDDAQQVVGRGNAYGGRLPVKKAPMMAKILSRFKR